MYQLCLLCTHRRDHPSTAYPSAATAYPSAATAYPSATTAYPSAATAYPSAATAYPSATTVNPSAIAAYPWQKRWALTPVVTYSTHTHTHCTQRCSHSTHSTADCVSTKIMCLGLYSEQVGSLTSACVQCCFWPVF